MSGIGEVVSNVLSTKIGPVKVWHIIAMIIYFGLRIYNRGKWKGGRKVAASHILVKDKELAEKLKKELQDGGDFEELAKKHSTCPSGKNGGSLGAFSAGQMVPAFDKICWTAPIGEVQGPAETQFGFHLILVTSRDDAKKKKAA